MRPATGSRSRVPCPGRRTHREIVGAAAALDLPGSKRGLPRPLRPFELVSSSPPRRAADSGAAGSPPCAWTSVPGSTPPTRQPMRRPMLPRTLSPPMLPSLRVSPLQRACARRPSTAPRARWRRRPALAQRSGPPALGADRSRPVAPARAGRRACRRTARSPRIHDTRRSSSATPASTSLKRVVSGERPKRIESGSRKSGMTPRAISSAVSRRASG